MKNLFLFIVLLQVLCISCQDKDDSLTDKIVGTWEITKAEEISYNIYGYNKTTKDLMGAYRFDQITFSANQKVFYKDINGHDLSGEWYLYTITTEDEDDLFEEEEDDEDDLFDCEDVTTEYFCQVDLWDAANQHISYNWKIDDSKPSLSPYLYFINRINSQTYQEFELVQQ